MATRPPEPPASGPTQEDVDNSETWEALASASTTSVMDSAEKWRNGLAALATLITGGLIIAGPNGADLPTAWRYTAAILTIGGVACAAVGGFIALTVSAGRPSVSDLPVVTAKYHTVQNYSAVQAAKQVKLVGAIQVLAMVSISALILGAGVWSVAPKALPNSPKLQVEVGTTIYCGTLLSADKGIVLLQVDGEKGPRAMPYATVTNFHVIDKC